MNNNLCNLSTVIVMNSILKEYKKICMLLHAFLFLQIETLNDKLSVICIFPFKSNVEILE